MLWISVLGHIEKGHAVLEYGILQDHDCVDTPFDEGMARLHVASTLESSDLEAGRTRKRGY